MGKPEKHNVAFLPRHVALGVLGGVAPLHEAHKQRLDVLWLIVEETDNNLVAAHFAEDIEKSAYSSRKRLNVGRLDASISMVDILAVDAICYECFN